MPTRPLAEFTAPASSSGRVAATAQVVYDGLGLPRAEASVMVQRGPGINSIVGVVSAVATPAAGAAQRLLLGGDEAVIDCGFAISPPVANAFTELRHEADLDSLVASGVTAVGLSTGDPHLLDALLARSDLTGVAYRAVTGEDALAAGMRWVVEKRRLEPPSRLRTGLALSATQGFDDSSLAELGAFAKAAAVPVALSLGGEGEASAVRRLHDLGLLEHVSAVVDGAAVDEDDVRLIARAGSAVVYAPRWEAVAGRPPFPWTLYAQHGVDVAFGTRAPVGGAELFDLVAEVRVALTSLGDRLNPRAAVRAAVKGGHRALGLLPPRVGRGAGAEELVVWI